MLANALANLTAIYPLQKFQYVGFGGLEFLDFDLFHRVLGFRDMKSIEKSGELSRFTANIPNQLTAVVAGESTDALTRIDWSSLSVVWLDYECPLNATVIDDVSYLCGKLTPGSFLAVTLNAHPGTLEGRADRFTQHVEAHRVPRWADDDTLGDWGMAKAQADVLYRTLRNALGKRVDNAKWHQVLNINYKDTTRMQLIGGLVSVQALESKITACGFDQLEFARFKEDPLHVEVPFLTASERHLLRARLPRKARQRVALPGVSKEIIESYAKLYRWIDL